MQPRTSSDVSQQIYAQHFCLMIYYWRMIPFLGQAKQDTIERVCEIVKNQLAVEEGKIVSGESKFVDLGADSLDTVIPWTN